MNNARMISNENEGEAGTVYNRTWSPDTASTNDSLTMVYSYVKEGATVLDVGCAIGQLGEALRQKKSCTVYGIDINSFSVEQAKKKLNHAQFADVTKTPLIEIFPHQKFDYIIFADVLEHLSNASTVLMQAQEVLNPGGSILISIPNVAHASVRLALLEGRFEYCDLGLLDTTHVRFYTRESLLDLLDKTKLVPVHFDRTILGARQTEINITARGVISDELINAIEKEPEATTYQFLVEAVQVTDDKLREGLIKRAKILEEVSQKAIRNEVEMDALLKRNPTGNYLSDYLTFLGQSDRVINELARHESVTLRNIEALKFELYELRKQLSEIDPTTIEADAVKEAVKTVMTTLDKAEVYPPRKRSLLGWFKRLAS